MNDYLAALTTIFEERPIMVVDIAYQLPVADHNLLFDRPVMIFDPKQENLNTIRASIHPLPFTFEGEKPALFVPDHLFDVWKMLNPSQAVHGVVPLSDAPPGRRLGCVLDWVLNSSAALMSDDTDALDQLMYISDVTHVDSTLSVPEQLAQVHDVIAPHLPEMSPTPALERTPFVFPNLLSIYDELTTGIFVVPDDTKVIRETDWSAVAGWFGQQFDRLLVTTDTHFKLLSQDVLSVSLTTGNVRHNWGQSLITDGMITPSALVGRALHNVLDIYTNVLPNAYMRAGEDGQAIRKVVHDIMNDLLRITFRHEVLSFDLPETEHIAPEPFSDDKNYQSQSERVLRIYDYVGDWVTFYHALYRELACDNKVA